MEWQSLPQLSALRTQTQGWAYLVFRHLFARKGDFICSYHGLICSPVECVTQPFTYLFSDPTDRQHRYIDSWTTDAGDTSYGGFINESFNDDEINCTIK
jgi:hypothetical protein